MDILLVLLPKQSSPRELRGLQSIVEIPLALAIQKQKHLRIAPDEPYSSSGINLGAAEPAHLSLEHHFDSATETKKTLATPLEAANKKETKNPNPSLDPLSNPECIIHPNTFILYSSVLPSVFIHELPPPKLD
jgi:hypothetical protein